MEKWRRSSLPTKWVFLAAAHDDISSSLNMRGRNMTISRNAVTHTSLAEVSQEAHTRKTRHGRGERGLNSTQGIARQVSLTSMAQSRNNSLLTIYTRSCRYHQPYRQASQQVDQDPISQRRQINAIVYPRTARKR